MQDLESGAAKAALQPCVLADVPERVRQIAMLRGLGYSYRQIAGPLRVTPQAIALMLARHRRALKSLRSALAMCSLSARAVNVLGRHGIRTPAQARQTDFLERLARERNCGRKTIDEIARWVEQDGAAGTACYSATVAAAGLERDPVHTGSPHRSACGGQRNSPRLNPHERL